MLVSWFLTLTALEVIKLAVFAGTTGSTIALAIFCIHQHVRIAHENQKLRLMIADLSSVIRRSQWLLEKKGQRTIIWSNERTGTAIESIGSLPVEVGKVEEKSDFLAFERWLTSESASTLNNAINALHEAGENFDIVIETQTSMTLNAEGFKNSRYTLVQFSSLSAEEKISAQLKLENQGLKAECNRFFSLLKKVGFPFWIRNQDGSLKWVNEAYAEAVESADPETTVKEKKELLETRTRERILHSRKRQEGIFSQNVSTVKGGDRKIYHVTDYKDGSGSAGIALDVGEIETTRQELQRINYDHAETLNLLTTAVANFDSTRKLRFYNESFRCLWPLEQSFLDSAPDHALLLDRLRSEGKIAERPEWRVWKDSVLAAYRSPQLQEDWWHLPDSRILRVIASPQSNGSVTWMFENLTEKIDLQSRYNAAMKVQGETLDNLVEGVAVFGPDGKLKLFNPSFLRLWNLEFSHPSSEIHITLIRDRCEECSSEPIWQILAEEVTGCDPSACDLYGQTTLKNGKTLLYRLIRLPNGQIMITWIDVTDSINIEHALQEKNEALEKADQLKNSFIQHVSYELRSPLTNIIGFAELMIEPETGQLNEKQREYLKYISLSSSTLRTIIDDILDLTTIDAGIMQLDITEVNIKEILCISADLVAERVKEKKIILKKDTREAPEKFFADQIRVRQVLYNLLGNAVNYAPAGGIIELGCRKVKEGTEFWVHDNGSGISDEVVETIFKRFESGKRRQSSGGTGLGLSIVKSFVELHGGKVRIESNTNLGTTVICFFRDRQRILQIEPPQDKISYEA